MRTFFLASDAARAPAAASADRGSLLRARAARTLALLLALLTAEGSARLALVYLERKGTSYATFDALLDAGQRQRIAAGMAHDGEWYHRLDADLGWVTTPGSSYGQYSLNAQGLRARRAYAPTPPEGVLRVAAFGDSFVHGDEVADDEAWAALLEASGEQLEVLNFGVSGYGLDQAFLRYLRDGRAFAPHLIVLGVIADDLLRGVNVFRPFLAPETGHQLTKPRFLLADDGLLRLLPNPLRSVERYRDLLAEPGRVLAEVARHDAFAPVASEPGVLDVSAAVRLLKLARATLGRAGDRRPVVVDGVFDVESEAVRLALATTTRFADAARAFGSRFLVVFFPDRAELEASRAGRPATYQPLLEELRARGVPLLDTLDGFVHFARDVPVQDLMRDFHYSPLGNAIVAEQLLDVVDPLLAAAR